MLVQPCAPCVAVAEPMGPFRLEPRPRARAQWCSLSRRGPDTAGSRVDWMPLNRPVAWLEADLRLDGDYCRGSGPCRAPFIDRRLLSWWPWLRPDPSRGQWHIGEKNNAPILRALGKPWVVHHPPLQHVLQSKSRGTSSVASELLFRPSFPIILEALQCFFQHISWISPRECILRLCANARARSSTL